MPCTWEGVTPSISTIRVQGWRAVMHLGCWLIKHSKHVSNAFYQKRKSPGPYQLDSCQQVEENDHPSSLLSINETPMRRLKQCTGLNIAMKVTNALKYLKQSDWLVSIIIQPGERKAQGNLIHVFKYLQEKVKRTVLHIDRMRGNERKMK